MNNELIERIDEVTNNWGSVSSFKASGVLIDCKAEIERLLLANETLKELNVEYLERVKLLETEAWRESKASEAKPVHGVVLLDAITASFRRGFSEGSSQGLLDNSNNQDAVACQVCAEVAQAEMDALIAEIDGLPRYHYAIEREGCLACEPHENGDTVDFGELQEALDKYRGVT